MTPLLQRSPRSQQSCSRLCMPPTFRSDNSPYPSPDAVRRLYADEGPDPAYARGVDALCRDSALAPLLGDGIHCAGEQPRARIPGAFIRTDTGNAWLLQSHTHLPAAFVHTAARYVLARGLPTDSIAPLLDELARVVARVRRLMAGEPDDATVLMAFHGLRIAEGVSARDTLGVAAGRLFVRARPAPPRRPFAVSNPGNDCAESDGRWPSAKSGSAAISRRLRLTQTFSPSPCCLALAEVHRCSGYGERRSYHSKSSPTGMSAGP